VAKAELKKQTGRTGLSGGDMYEGGLDVVGRIGRGRGEESLMAGNWLDPLRGVRGGVVGGVIVLDVVVIGVRGRCVMMFVGGTLLAVGWGVLTGDRGGVRVGGGVTFCCVLRQTSRQR